MAGIFRCEPTLNAEIRCWRQGYRRVAGVDEAGRGPLAGPVLAAAVILDPDSAHQWWSDLRDSKMLPAPRREELAALIRDTAEVGVGAASHEEIDALGLAPAGRLAMARALADLRCRPDHLLLDAFALPEVDLPQQSIIHGDALSASIAAASIIAKVTRDRLMVELDGRFPGYGLAEHKGYGCASHMAAIVRLGPCEIHRKTFRGVKEHVKAGS